ncbi:hypothetical protein [Maribellus maritimus]|uniref:hypothetical protein n=1 Tax=Maribellus maritimus TaxID=2870838 RepID=UPI001EE9F44C|nr:hypothetical protein [Maribellus maritimus]MCG6191523.1 hypothetical protein [Maribellus maritimus]
MINHKLLFNLIYSLTLMTVFNTPVLYGQSNSVIGLTVDFKAPKGPAENADRIYFIKLQEDTNNLKVDSVIQSNFQMDNQIYLTDINPGKYAIVAIGKKKILPIYGLTELTTFFSKELVKENIVTVDSNDFVYMGNYSLTTKMMVSNKKSDDIQLHYFKLITGNESVPRYMRQVSLDTWFYKATPENLKIEMTDKHNFLMEALNHFQGLEQNEIIRTEMEKNNCP